MNSTERYLARRESASPTFPPLPATAGHGVRIHKCTLKGVAIKRSKKFEEKGLAKFSVNVGLKCSHGCTGNAG
jgi:hypothetical protein